jgi:tRNA(Arg) A34 adenosine deaminase TadA
LFAFPKLGVTPDVLTVAKGLANGLPIGATLARPDVADLLKPGDHASTFSGGPVVCRAGLAVLSALTPELLSRVGALGARMRGEIAGWKKEVPGVKTVRGEGLMIGIELDRPGAAVVEACREAGLLVNRREGHPAPAALRLDGRSGFGGVGDLEGRAEKILNFLKEALRLAALSVRRGGGPFGAVVVKGGRVVGRGHNRVALDLDPTAHAEVVALRDACRRLKTFALKGCVLYASCEPCPLCLSAALWSRVDRIVFAAGRRDAARAGFDDEVFYRELRVRPRGKLLPLSRRGVSQALRPFALWSSRLEKVLY